MDNSDATDLVGLKLPLLLCALGRARVLSQRGLQASIGLGVGGGIHGGHKTAQYLGSGNILEAAI
jgi:hypothetical protein